MRKQSRPTMPVSVSLTRSNNGVVSIRQRFGTGRYIEIEMTLEELGLIITGMSDVPLTAHLRNVAIDITGTKK